MAILLQKWDTDHRAKGPCGKNNLEQGSQAEKEHILSRCRRATGHDEILPNRGWKNLLA